MVTSVESANSKGRDKQSFNISKYNQFEFKTEMQGSIITRDFIDGITVHTFRLRLSKTPVPLPSKFAYNSKIPINKKKLKDIQSVFQYIDEEHDEFYQDILQWPTKEKEEDSEVETENV
ncbi:unnamed protein product [Brassicogethes aeneus]|uniref:Uncharacterized protein n=1 Tax=Brassicogethes aeneus TaxID=1431903 RepID=A0A9P0BAC3_BRAAE|nr:unnamed protein product [Brassicogethes aeneus]